ncbi:hypothetical protein [Mariniblastus fucicola]|uniref:Uncharacterized protein n=1 Tax=Mariniblastus fucicola TaxID=980251 RepID=A0A5B9P385_9BACT|nr:hypothetical protein [Mariniblastus fucicola]QEG21007.1 hypothetical protein MFFC18_08590 [Mariniblastus fucicola]
MSSESKPKLTLNLPCPGGGQIQAAVWENEQSKDGETFTSHGVTIQRRYYDDEDKKWKSAKGFKDIDLLTLAFAAQELYRQIQGQKQK